MPQLQWQPWRWLTAIVLAIMDMSWILACLSFLQRNALERTWPEKLLGLLIVLLTGFLLSRVTYTLKLTTLTRRVILAIFFLLSYLGLLHLILYAQQGLPLHRIFLNMHTSFLHPSGLVPVEFSVLALCLYLWLRGVALGITWIGTQSVRRSLRVGIFVFLWLGLFWPQELELLGLCAVVFLLSSVMAHTFARANTLHLMRGGRRTSFNYRWLLVVQIIAITLIAVSMFAGGRFYEELGSVALTVLSLTLILVVILALIVASPLLVLIMIGFPLLYQRMMEMPILDEMSEILRQVFDRLLGLANEVGMLFDGLSEHLPLIQRLIAYGFWLIIIVIVLGFSLWLGRRRVERQPEIQIREVEDLKENISPHLSALRKVFQDQISRWSRWFSQLRPGSRWLGAMRIRAIYARLMDLCDQLGTGRKEVETPMEFLATLRQLFPHEDHETGLITAAYIRVRYGELPETREEVKQVEEAWRTLKARAKDLKVAQAAHPASQF